MATAEQRARRAAQRATAARVKASRSGRSQPRTGLSRTVGRAATKAQVRQAEAWLNGTEKPTGKLERHQAARMASLAMYGKANPDFYNAFKQYFYRVPGWSEADEQDLDDAELDEDEE